MLLERQSSVALLQHCHCRDGHGPILTPTTVILMMRHASNGIALDIMAPPLQWRTELGSTAQLHSLLMNPKVCKDMFLRDVNSLRVCVALRIEYRPEDDIQRNVDRSDKDLGDTASLLARRTYGTGQHAGH